MTKNDIVYNLKFVRWWGWPELKGVVNIKKRVSLDEMVIIISEKINDNDNSYKQKNSI